MKAEDDKGSGEQPEVPNRPKRRKHQGPTNQGRSEEPGKSTTQSKHESDSQGGEKGDKAGGGGEGSGQRANQAGAGGGGQNTAADQGNSKAPGAGKGETGSQAGQQVGANRPTGAQGSRAGPGSTRQQGQSTRGSGPQGPRSPTPPGSRSRGDSPENASPQQGASQGKPRLPSGGSNQVGPSSGGNEPGQGLGRTADPRAQGSKGTRLPQTKEPPRAPGGEDPNLEFSRKQTSLVLEYLKHQLENDQVDPELLRRLGWTREDLRRFVQRWEQIQRQAQQPGPEGRRARRLLRNLGLRPRSSKLSTSVPQQKLRRLRQGFRATVPPEQLEQYKAFTQGRNRSRNKK